MGNLVGKDESQQTQQAPTSSTSSRYRAESGMSIRAGQSTISSSTNSIGRASIDVTGSPEPLQQAPIPDSTKDDGETEEINEECLDQLEEDKKVPMVFRWDGGGKNVYITGTFNKWSEKIPMRQSGNDFTYIRDLKRGKHAYKFIVDDEWRFAPDQPTVADPHGYINNFVDLSNFTGNFGSDMKPLNAQDAVLDDKLYDNITPDPEDPQWYSKEPPPLPPHLRQIILNVPQISNDSLAAKPVQVPQHVTLNHLYCSAIKENLMVLGVSQRYRSKFVTTVFYSPLPDASQVGRDASYASAKIRAKS